MSTQKELKKAIVELNDLLGLDPQVDPKGSEKELMKGIKAALKLITPADTFSAGTQAVLDEIKPPVVKAAAPAKGKKAPVVVEDDEDEDEDDDEDADEDDDDEEEEEEEEIPAPKAKGKKPVAPAPAPKAKGKKAPVVVEDDDDDEEEEEEEIPAPKAKKGKKAPIVVEEDDEEEEEKPKAKKSKKEEAAPKTKKTKEEIFKGPGIIKTIVDLLEKSGKKGLSIEEIHAHLVANFPDRDSKSMLNTVRVQVPGRISKEKFELEKLSTGNFRKKVAKA